MKLYNVVLGNQELVPDKFSHIVDEYGNNFITKEDIRQRMRIDKTIAEEDRPELGVLTPQWSTSNMQCYDIIKAARWANNNRNMNPLLLNNTKYEEGKEQMVIYLTVSNNYAIIRFSTKHRILQTYHKKDVYQGCTVVLNSGDRKIDKEIINLKVYDKKNDEYKTISVRFIDDETSKINVVKKSVSDKKTIEMMKSQIEKYKDRYLGFKIITKPKDILTLAYITSEKYKDVINAKIKSINNPKIYVVDNNRLHKDEDYSNEFIQKIHKEFSDNNIRTLTLCGVDLTLPMIRELRVLYVFTYDVKHNTLSCRKSN